MLLLMGAAQVQNDVTFAVILGDSLEWWGLEGHWEGVVVE